MPKQSHTQIKLGDRPVPVKIIRERRLSWRASVGKESLILRLPLLLPQSEENAVWSRFCQWVEHLYFKKPGAFNRFFPKAYEEGDILEVGSRRYQIGMVLEDRKTHAAKLHPNRYIELRLAASTAPDIRSQQTKQLLSRVIAQDFLPEISRRVEELNRLYFNKTIRAVRFKYNASNWGSCSRTGVINLSTRLLFAPSEVIDYVIIHELAHLVEFNHSPRFWALVEKAMPEYKTWVKWLKSHNHQCDF